MVPPYFPDQIGALWRDAEEPLGSLNVLGCDNGALSGRSYGSD